MTRELAQIGLACPAYLRNGPPSICPKRQQRGSSPDRRMAVSARPGRGLWAHAQ